MVFLTALGLALMIEGLLYAAFPEQMKRMLAMLLEMPSGSLRLGALVCAGFGLVVVALTVGAVGF
jgi:uncharacterized protein YjeT (DUF2065 family)